MKISKKDLNDIAFFLTDVKLSGSTSRARSKLLTAIKVRIKELKEDQDELLSENGGIETDNGLLQFTTVDNKREFIESQEALYSEEIILSEDFVGQFSKIKSGIENYDEPVSGNVANGFDKLLTLLEDEEKGNN